MAIQLENSGGAISAPNRAPAAKVIAGALANSRVAQALIAALGSYSASAAIVATSTSTSVDFAALQVGDVVLHVPAIPGSVDFASVLVAGTAPAAAVVGDLYIAIRLIDLDANNPLIPPTTAGVPAGNNARFTGAGGTEF